MRRLGSHTRRCPFPCAESSFGTLSTHGHPAPTHLLVTHHFSSRAFSPPGAARARRSGGRAAAGLGRLRPGHHSHTGPTRRRAGPSPQQARRGLHNAPPPPSSTAASKEDGPLPPPPSPPSLSLTHGRRRAETGATAPSPPLTSRPAASEDGSPRLRLYPLRAQTDPRGPTRRDMPAIPPDGRLGTPRRGWGRNLPVWLRIKVVSSRTSAPSPPPHRLAARKDAAS